MKTSTLLKLVAAGTMLFQFETVLGAEFGVPVKASSAAAPTKATVYQKVFKQLSAKNPKITKEQLEKLGPGVTGGGDSCEQKIAYSYSFLLGLIQKDKISASVFNNMDKQSLLNMLTETQFGFDHGLKKNRPVEALNAPQVNAILLDRAVCNNNFEPLSYYAPLLMHEALRLAGMQEADANYAISKNYIATIRREADLAVNNKRNFRILTGTASGAVALAWGLGGQLVDFEALDKMSEDEQVELIHNSEAPLENYLIDLKRMKIISVIGNNYDCGDRDLAPDRNCAWAELNNKLDYNWESFSFLMDSNSNIGFRMLNSRYHAWIESIYALNDKQQIIGECSKNCNDIVEKAVEASLTRAQKEELSRWLVSYSYEVKYSKEGSWEITVEGSDTESADGYHLKANMKLEFVNGRFKATVGKFRFISEEEIRASWPVVE